MSPAVARTAPRPRPVGLDHVGPTRKQKNHGPAVPRRSAGPAGYSAIEDPGKTLGIVGFVLAFVFAVAGIVVSAIARKKSKEAGFDNQLAKWGLILSIVFTVLWVIGVIIYVAAIAALVASGDVATY